MDKSELNNQIDELLLQLIDGTISDEGFVLLKRWFDENAGAADYFCRFLSDFAAVKIEFNSRLGTSQTSLTCDGLDPELWEALAETEKTAPAIQMQRRVSKPAVVGDVQPVATTPRKVNKSLIAVAMISLAAFLVLAAYVHFNPRTLPPIVGVLTDAVDVKWSAQTKSLIAGQDLRAGTLDLQEGLVGIRLDSGARIIIEGPAKIELQSFNSLFLRQGCLVATVARDAVGFVVNTPRGKVLDLGTEFGVQVDEQQNSEIHVFQGEVLFYPEFNLQNVVVSAGNARSISSNSEVETVPLRPQSFVRSKELVSRVLAQQGNEYHRWKSSIFNWHRDPTLKAHYLYDQQPSSGSEPLLNSAPLTAGRLNGLVSVDERSAPTWVQGRWSQKNAIHFERGKNQVIHIAPDPSICINGPITISTWVYFPDGSRMGGHLVSCREEYSVNYQFSIFDDHYVYDYQRNQFEFLRYNDRSEKGCYSTTFQQQPGQWYHFVVTHDTEMTRFYVNGELFEKKPYKTQIAFVKTGLVLGAMKMGDRYVLKEGDFDGVVDELMIFARQLHDDEIRAIYENGRPVSH